MKIYATFVGNWNPISQEYRFQKLPGACHTALEDCHATLSLLKMLSEEDILPIPEGYTPIAKEKTSSMDEGSKTIIGCLFAIIILIILYMVMCK